MIGRKKRIRKNHGTYQIIDIPEVRIYSELPSNISTMVITQCQRKHCIGIERGIYLDYKVIIHFDTH